MEVQEHIMKVLYHECTDSDGTKLPVEFLDGGGRLWIVPFGEPTEFENSFMADKILEHMKYMGIVEVTFSKTRTGITYDMEDAIKRAHSLLLAQEKACINDYVRIQLESRVRQNFPPLPPAGRALSCIIKHKVNLLKYGLRPVGWEPPYEMEDKDTPFIPVAAGVGVEDRIIQLERLLGAQQKLIDALTKGGGAAVGSGGGTRSGRPPVAVTAGEVLQRDAAPAPPPAIDIHDGADDTYESINL